MSTPDDIDWGPPSTRPAPVVHRFDECLAQSHAAEDYPIWEPVYRTAFPNFAAMVNTRDDGWWQRAGVDRVVILKTSKEIRIDEKVRGRSKVTGLVYPDILLEYISNDRTNAPGWCVKPLLADYIAYAIAPLGICHFLPVIQLQAAWARHGEDWIKKYKKREAPNPGYKTLSCPVPAEVLYPAIGACLRVPFERFEVTE